MTVNGLPSRIGILGGTFDPPQNGHIAVANSVIQHANLDVVLFVPAGDPWQKNEEATAQQRLEMVALAIDGHPGLAVSTVDIDRAGPTYTVDTLSDIHAQYPGAELFFILGDDAFAGIHTWNNVEKLADLAQFIVVSRVNIPVEIPSFLAPRVNLIEVPTLPISSTMCRERIQSGLSLESLVPGSVVDYIEQHQLYRSTE